MTMSESSLIRDFVRGRRESNALTVLGASLALGDDVLRLSEPATAPVYEATATDVAVGLLASWAIGTTLQQWARVLLATGMVDLSSLEDHPRGEALLNAVWGAADGSGQARLNLRSREWSPQRVNEFGHTRALGRRGPGRLLGWSRISRAGRTETRVEHLGSRRPVPIRRLEEATRGGGHRPSQATSRPDVDTQARMAEH